MGFEILLLFPMCSHQVFNGFPKHSASSQRAPQHVLNSTLLHPISPTIGLYPTHNEWVHGEGGLSNQAIILREARSYCHD